MTLKTDLQDIYNTLSWMGHHEVDDSAVVDEARKKIKHITDHLDSYKGNDTEDAYYAGVEYGKEQMHMTYAKMLKDVVNVVGGSEGSIYRL